jgi:hypothetical protein
MCRRAWRLVWLERQSVQVNLPLLEPILAAVRTEAPPRLRQEEIVSSKTFACGYRLGLTSQKEGRSIINPGCGLNLKLPSMKVSAFPPIQLWSPAKTNFTVRR